MNSDPQLILTEILNIIEYQDNKQEFIDKFFILCQKTALDNLIEKLPQEKKVELDQVLDKDQTENSLTKISEIIEKEQYKQELENATKNQFQEYLEAVIPHLSQEQVEKLSAYLNSLNSTFAPTP